MAVAVNQSVVPRVDSMEVSVQPLKAATPLDMDWTLHPLIEPEEAPMVMELVAVVTMLPPVSSTETFGWVLKVPLGKNPPVQAKKDPVLHTGCWVNTSFDAVPTVRVNEVDPLVSPPALAWRV